LAEVAAEPDRVAEILGRYAEVLVAFSPTRVILAANASADRYFGYERSELNGQPTDIIVPARFRQPDAPPQLAKKDLTTVELPCLRKDGSEVATIWTFGSVSSGTAEPVLTRPACQRRRAPC
jgi:PAS domain S-box-containing protein